jgi:methylglutaconyl-CoA hydratase
VTILHDTDAHGIAHITLDRPAVHNAFDEALIAALAAAFVAAAGDAAVRAIVLRGNGPSLCAGADLAWMRRAAGYTAAQNQADAQVLSDLFAAIDGCCKPVIAVAHGSVFGGGVGLLACTDLVVAVRGAKFRLSEVRLGLTPATISPFVLRAIGARAARRWFLTAEVFGADAALGMGLATALADDAAAAEVHVLGWLAALRECAPGAVADAKALIRDYAGVAITPALRSDSAMRIAARRASDEGQEGIAAFLEKRRAGWVD